MIPHFMRENVAQNRTTPYPRNCPSLFPGIKKVICSSHAMMELDLHVTWSRLSCHVRSRIPKDIHPRFCGWRLGFVYFHFGVLKFYPDLSPRN